MQVKSSSQANNFSSAQPLLKLLRKLKLLSYILVWISIHCFVCIISTWLWCFAAQTLLEVVENQDNVHLASDFGSLPQDSTHDLLLEDVLEEDEELLENQQENGEGAEAIGDDTTDLDLSATGTTRVNIT